ncbi:thiol:disulfide interchange protein [Desulfovibrio sp. DS-1]|nr:thioredoxin family protein [Nitratidesulfovibrio sp. SRB-5]RXF76670.1 thiol:disulfide interchange protein [Desulfovibrio sp. DS-1]
MKKENKIMHLNGVFFCSRVSLAVLVWLFCAAFSLHAADLSVPEGGSTGLGPRPEVTVEVFREVRAGEDGVLAVVWLEMPSGYHAYANDMDGSGGKGSGVGLPTVVTVRGASSQASAPARAAAPVGTPGILYPPGREIMDPLSPGQRVLVYEGRAPVFVRLPQDHLDRDLTASVSLLLCSDRNCLPYRGGVGFRVDGAALGQLPRADDQPWMEQLRTARPGVQVASARLGEDAATAGQPAPTAAGSGAFPAVAPAAVATPAKGTQDAQGAQEQGDRVTIPFGKGGRSVPLPGMPDAQAAANATEGAVSGSLPGTIHWNFAPRYQVPELEVSGLGKALLLGLLAGLLLNLMPCVLPVISLKLSGFVAVAGLGGDEERRAHFREHNLLFAAGIMAWFLLLAFILGGAGLAWGQLFQRPGVVMGLLMVVFGLGLSMFGLFTLPVLDLKAVGAGGSGRAQPFFTGLVATLLATPCSGPLLGGVLGWAFQQPPEIMAFVFTSVGMGMALPYLVLAARPGLVRHFPRPGAWTGTLEQLVGFFLMGTAVYLLTILPDAWLMPALVTLLAVAFAAWIWGRWGGLDASPRRRTMVRLTAPALVAVAVWLAFAPSAPPARWEPFEPATFRAMLGREPLIVDFTADWCPNCKLLEQTTLSSGAVSEWSRRYGARLVRVDLTAESPEAQALLRSLGSSSIPVVALFPKGLLSASPVVLRDLFTTGQMEQALLEAFGKPKQEWAD